MDFETYSKNAYMHMFAQEGMEHVIFPMGLCGEAGEVAEKFKKMHRDTDGGITEEFKESVKKELGDVLWYINAIAKNLGIPLEEVAQENLDKISSRAARNVQRGSGDDR